MSDRANVYARSYRQRNREMLAAKQRAYRKEHLEAIKDYRRGKRVEIVAYMAEYRGRDPKRHAEHQRLYREQNRDRIAAQRRAYREANRDVIAAKKAAYHRRNRDAELARMRENKYGISSPRYRELLAAQDGRCALCRELLIFGRGRSAVDHDHKTGQIRGVLCGRCNTALGKFGDDPARLRRAAEYVEELTALRKVGDEI